jgi:4-oxalocrotonate tautomerase
MEDQTMPIINVRLIEGVFTADQKNELLPKLTDAVEDVYPGIRDVTFVTIEEVRQSDWGIGGQPITADKVAEHAQRNLKAPA